MITDSDLAILGLSGRFPGASDLETFTMNSPPQVQVLAHRLNHYLAPVRV